MNLKRTALMLTASAMMMFAQGGGPPAEQRGGDPQQMLQRRIDHLATRLGLTDAQKASATKIFTDAMTSSESLRTSMETARQGLQDAIKANNTSAIESLSAQSGNLQGQLMAIHAKAEAAFYALLTAEQKTKYNQRPERGPGGPGGMAPGGMGGPLGPHFGGRR